MLAGLPTMAENTFCESCGRSRGSRHSSLELDEERRDPGGSGVRRLIERGSKRREPQRSDGGVVHLLMGAGFLRSLGDLADADGRMARSNVVPYANFYLSPRLIGTEGSSGA